VEAAGVALILVACCWHPHCLLSHAVTVILQSLAVLTWAVQDRDIVADLMARLEQRTAERNEALQAAAGAEQRLKVQQLQLHCLCAKALPFGLPWICLLPSVTV